MEGGIQMEKKTYDGDFTGTRRQNSDGKKPYDPPKGTSSRWNSDGKEIVRWGDFVGTGRQDSDRKKKHMTFLGDFIEMEF